MTRKLPILCFGLFLAAISASNGVAMSFDLVSVGNPAKCRGGCPEIISATGEITLSTPRDFYNFIAGHLHDPRLHTLVALNSPGGSVAASMRLGAMFRTVGITAMVARLAGGNAVTGRCFSACAYALIGAKKRIIPPSSLVGIHRMSYVDVDSDVSAYEARTVRRYGSPEYVSQLADYARRMGVSPDMIYTAEHVSPDNLHIVTSGEMRRWRLGGKEF
jgi:hypothetical protein